MTYLIIVFILSFLILFHELGHYIAARSAGIPIDRLSIGFGPALYKKRKGGTEYWISAIPIGGYVLPALSDENEYFRIPVYKRIILAAGGPIVNLILPIFLFGIVNAISGDISISAFTVRPVVQTVELLSTIVASLANLFTSPDKLSGIVGIVKQGSEFVGLNLVRGISFTIMLSVNLAVFNLLPLPALDGGKIILSLLEKIHPRLRKVHVPLSLAGWLLLAGVLVYATVMDIGKLIRS